jgi:membrane protein
MAAGAEAAPERRLEGVGEFGPRNWWFVLKRVVVGFGADNLTLVAAGCAFYALLALVPAMTALVLVYGLVADPATVAGQVESLAGVVPADVLGLVAEQLQRLVAEPSGGLSWGLAIALGLALWSASAGMRSLLTALNVAYREEEKRGLIGLGLLGLAFTVAAVVSVFVAIVTIVGVPVVLGVVGLGGVAETLVRLVRWPIIGGLLIIGLAILYRYGPSRARARWRWISLGSIVATVLWLVASIGFSWYVTSFASYNKTYGSLGAVVVLMLWLYISVLVIILGAKLDAETEHETAVDTTTGRPRPLGQRGAAMADHVAPHE